MIPRLLTRAALIVAIPLCTGADEIEPTPPVSAKSAVAACLSTGDGYLRAQLGGSIVMRVDWPNSGTRCDGESRPKSGGVRLSFQRASGTPPNLLFIFGLNGVKAGKDELEAGANVTIFVQGTSKIYSTLGDSRCTVDSLTQRPLEKALTYRIEARGFCTQPAHAVRGRGDVLMSTFEFAGPITYDADAL